ncbi:MAG: glycosyltransferase, partial [Pseudomonadota bacterium]
DHFPSFFTEVPFFGTVNQPDRVRRYLEAEAPDVIITTHFGMAMTLGYLRELGYFSEVPVSWVHLDVLSNFFFYQVADYLDQVFLPNQGMVDKWADYIDPEKLTASGVPIMPAMLNRSEPTEFHSSSAQQLDPSLPTVMLMGGSMGALSYDQIISQISRHYADKDQIQIVAVCGRNERARQHLESWKTSDSQLEFPQNIRLVTTGYIGLSELMELQSIADVIVSKPGGLSSFELLTTSKPTVLTEGIGIQETRNAEYMANNGAALFLPKVDRIGETIKSVLEDPDMAGNLVSNAKRLSEEFRAERINEWVRNAQVLQPHRPELPVLQRHLGRDEQTQKWWLSLITPTVRQCQVLLSGFRKMRDRQRNSGQ